MLLRNLEIHQFRTFEYLHVERFGQVNLIVGRNNVGKSSVLEALRVYANLGAPQILLDILDSRDDHCERAAEARGRTGGTEPALHHLFHGYPPLRKIVEPIRIGPYASPDSTLRIGIEWMKPGGTGNGSEGLIRVENPDLLSDSELIAALTIRIGGFHRFFRLDQDFTTHIMRWQNQPRSFLDLITPCITVGPNSLSRADLDLMWEKVALSDLERDVVDCLNIIFPGVDACAILKDQRTGQPSVRIKHPKFTRPHPLKSLGDGTGRLFALTLALVTAQGGILLIDEIENGVHYSVLPDLWRFVAKVAKRLDVQVFATSHSLDCIKAFHEVTHADTSIEGVLNRIEVRKGAIRAALFDEQKLDRFLDEGIELR